MRHWSDLELIHAYAEEKSEDAFRQLVERYRHLVYSTSLRELENKDLAEDVTQAVFLLLAQRASSFRKGSVLAGWLFRTTHLACTDILKQEKKRQRREQKICDGLVHQSQSKVDGVTWPEIEPVLNESLCILSDEEQSAIILRYFQDSSLKEVGAALNISEDAARMRISRALEKMRRHFRRNGFILSAFTIPILLSNNASEAASAAHLTGTSVAASVRGIVATTRAYTTKQTIKASVSTLLESVARKLLWNQLKPALLVFVPLLVVGTSAFKIRQQNTAEIASTLRNPQPMQAFVPAKSPHNQSSKQKNQPTPVVIHAFQEIDLTPLRKDQTLIKNSEKVAAPMKKLKSLQNQIKRKPSTLSRASRFRFSKPRIIEVVTPQRTKPVHSRKFLSSVGSGKMREPREDIYPPEDNAVEFRSAPFNDERNREANRRGNQGEKIGDDNYDLIGLPPGIARKVKSGRLQIENLPPGLTKKRFNGAFFKNNEDEN